MCRGALGQGVVRLCLTDHCDLVDEFGVPCDEFSWEDVEQQLELARREFPGLDLRKGVELGQAVLRPAAAERVLARPGIDFVLGSMHNDPKLGDYYCLHPADRAEGQRLLERYLQSLLALAKTDYFDSLAHLTYPLRYMNGREELGVSLAPYGDLVREILRTLAERGKALELNTSGYRTLGEPMPGEGSFRWARSWGASLLLSAATPMCRSIWPRGWSGAWSCFGMPGSGI